MIILYFILSEICSGTLLAYMNIVNIAERCVCEEGDGDVQGRNRRNKERYRYLPYYPKICPDVTQGQGRIIVMGTDEKIKILKHGMIFSCLLVFAILLAGICYAQNDKSPTVVAPEPGTMMLVSTGFIGWVVSVARRRFQQFKRAFDIIASSAGLVLITPIVACVALLIKIVSPGPVFFKQERVGYKGKLFDIYKMRTMKVDAEKDTGPVWAKENDSRLIKFGKLVRRLHIDELPQLLNVLRGDMSIVGPRPERPVFVERLNGEISDYKKRINVKPGITGLAQVWHKYDETISDVRKKVKYDLLYIREMCFMVDLRILFRTILVAATGKGAR
jgi:lipopolysaccharide/colanic/teichoic acid biosynthesis glycosyltransferase